MNIKIINKWVLIERLPISQKTKSGLELPLVALEKSSMGRLFAVSRHSHLGRGSYVLFPKMWDLTVHVGDKEYLYMPEKELLAEVIF